NEKTRNARRGSNENGSAFLCFTKRKTKASGDSQAVGSKMGFTNRAEAQSILMAIVLTLKEDLEA
ncbi:MAG: hypothetical protein ACKVJK_15795, partial [Methylophagaceae bacterium]